MSVNKDYVKRWAAQVALISGQSILTFIGVIITLQVLASLAPGDAIDSLQNSDQIRPALVEDWGLDKPLYLRVIHQIGATLSLNFGTSLVVHPGASVTSMMKGPGVTSMAIVAAALVLSTGLSILCAWARVIKGLSPRYFTWIHYTSAPPIFLIGALAIGGINSLTWTLINSGWISRPAFFALPIESSWLPSGLAILTLAVGSGLFSRLFLSIEATLTEIDLSPYVMSSRGQGRVLTPHYVRNALIPLTSTMSKNVPILIGSLVVLDPVFNINGVGRLFWRAAEVRDVPILIGVGLTASAMVIAARWMTQIMEYSIEPRRSRPTHAH